MRAVLTTRVSRRALFLGSAILCLSLPAKSATFTEFFTEKSGAFIIAGPDGALWYTHNSWPNDGVGRITVSGDYTKIDVPGLLNMPWDITLGPAGELWFTESDAAIIRRLSRNGAWKEFVIPRPANSITVGPDGNLWFTEAAFIGRLTPTGTVTEFPVPTQMPSLGQITAGPDGNLWFTETRGDKIGRITPSGKITEFPLAPGSWPFSIVAGPDSHLWFTEGFGNRIGRLSTAGGLAEFELLQPNSEPRQIAVGPDGNLWFTEGAGGRIGRITPQGVITEFSVPNPDRIPSGLTFGPDGNLWYLYVTMSQVGRMTLGGTAVNGPCTASDTILCIDDVPGDRRFQVEIEYQTAQGSGLSGKGKAIPLVSLGVARGGLFWFFNEDNPEIVVKVLNGCASNQKYWVFVSGGTNVGLTITVSDTVTGEVHSYFNRDLTPFAPVQDTSALSCGH